MHIWQSGNGQVCFLPMTCSRADFYSFYVKDM